jgi:hypothetical protein
MATDDNNHDDERPPENPRPPYRGRGEEQTRDYRSPLERLIPELLRRGIEAGRDTLKQTDEALRNVSEAVFAKELVNHFFAQFGDIRQTLSKAIAKEIGRVLEERDLSAEMRKVLNGMTVEAKIQLKFPEGEQEKGSTDATDETSKSAEEKT